MLNTETLPAAAIPCRGEGGPIISGHQVRMAPHPIVIADKSAEGTPVVSLRREGNIIREIQIRCACGELIILDCDYPL
ncbi:hypothetical protein [Planctomicrobium sp. SH664]|uniref:hypothetical protein n=1 Tax=Planctomicrobium sp. SH664 TaxID=3448125 RepID=UPI003F5C0928